jgi:hypothetical protein
MRSSIWNTGDDATMGSIYWGDVAVVSLQSPYDDYPIEYPANKIDGSPSRGVVAVVSRVNDSEYVIDEDRRRLHLGPVSLQNGHGHLLR